MERAILILGVSNPKWRLHSNRPIDIVAPDQPATRMD